jgi:hypothetical protein
MNLVFGRRDDTGYFIPRIDAERVDHLLERALKAEDALFARKAEQAAKQSDSTQTVNLNGRRYVWRAAPRVSGQIGKDGGFWMLEPGDYSHITDGIPLTMNVQQMATALINAYRKPPERDEPRAATWSERYLNAARQAQVDAVRDAVVSGVGAYKRTVDKDGNVTEESIDPREINAIDQRDPGDETVNYPLEDIEYAPWEREAMVDETADDTETEEFCENPYYLAEGDVVQLRSGSNHLTVEEILTECEVCGSPVELSVVWWDFAESRIQRDRVLANTVDRIEA